MSSSSSEEILNDKFSNFMDSDEIKSNNDIPQMESIKYNNPTTESSPNNITTKDIVSGDTGVRDPDRKDSNFDDKAKVLVIILQCETKACDSNIRNLKWLFSDPYFIVQICSVDVPDDIPINKNLPYLQYVQNYRMRKALVYAAEGPYISNKTQGWWKNIPCIIIKDSSVSTLSFYGDNSTSLVMKKRIQMAISKGEKADLFFLCKWNDACSKYINVTEPTDETHDGSLKWSMQPTATQAIMYTPSSRDYVKETLTTTEIPLGELLNHHISIAKLSAIVFLPNIIDFDADLSTSDDDYVKLNECAPDCTVSDNNMTTMTYIWLGVMILLAIIVAWILITAPQ